jgi:hypothetical protein
MRRSMRYFVAAGSGDFPHDIESNHLLRYRGCQVPGGSARFFSRLNEGRTRPFVMPGVESNLSGGAGPSRSPAGCSRRRSLDRGSRRQESNGRRHPSILPVNPIFRRQGPQIVEEWDDPRLPQSQRFGLGFLSSSAVRPRSACVASCRWRFFTKFFTQVGKPIP